MKKILSFAQVILTLALLVVVVRHRFFGWESFTYVIACIGVVAGVYAYLELSKVALKRGTK